MDLLDKHLDHYQKSFFEMANEKTREAIARKIEMAGIVIDIDSFKTINDTYGFEIGDIVLREIKNVVSSIEVDANCEYVVERYGGDEFRILMQGSLEEAKSLADEINRSVASIDYSMYVDELTTTVTLGVAMLESDKGAATMFAHATTAMYQGKDSGGNNITIYK
jgi:diguanylate cyclase (GGDEF)-like protein